VPPDTRLTAVRIGDLALLAQPGEPVGEYGVRAMPSIRFGHSPSFSASPLPMRCRP
jgi:hypothetical protein